MKGSGSWSMESLHGVTLPGARGSTGFVMFWYCWESGKIARRINVEAKNVNFLQSLFHCSVEFNLFFI